MTLRYMTWFVRAAVVYNISGVITLLTPGVLPALGVTPPYSLFWQWLPGLFGIFATIVLLFSSADLEKYGSFVYWNGIIRLIFVVATFALDFGGSTGGFAVLLALGDIPLAIVCIFGMPYVLKRSHLNLLLNR